MPETGTQLGDFLAQARTHGLRRILALTVADAGLGLGAAALCASIVAGITHRGDLVAAGVGPAGVIGLVALIVARVVAARRLFRDPLTVARTIATTCGPLRRAGADVVREAVLRHEILGATELLLALDADRPARSSAALARRYVEDVAARSATTSPDLAGPQAAWRPRSTVLGVLAFTVFVLGNGWPPLVLGASLVVAGRDGRPPRPAVPVWSSLDIELTYPAHTGRAKRAIPNPSGALRVPAGTRVDVRMAPREPAGAAAIVVTYDHVELQHAVPPEVLALELAAPDEGHARSFEGSFVARGSGNWTVVLLDDGDDDLDGAGRRSGALALELEPDRHPEIELLPLAAWQREASETDIVSLRFRARDDFGLIGAQLVYQIDDGETFRVQAGRPADGARSWQRRHEWDLSSIPIEDRSEVLYWIEVRDNDPGLGLEALPDPPGKVTRSATMRLAVRDEESEHAANIENLRAIRDAAVDLLARRMITFAFSSEHDLPERVHEARELSQLAGELLAKLASAIDSSTMDALIRERDVLSLASIHERLIGLHRKELELHEGLPPGSERDQGVAPGALSRLAAHNRRSVGQLEDEIIRLDDLVDGLTMERLEGLVARLQATQQKLVELLEQLRAGDESVRPQIDQLEQRRREDLRRVAEARARLRKEVGEEFMNLDAFESLDEMREQSVDEMLREGDVDGALERARENLDEIRGLRDAVQSRLGTEGGGEMSAEDRQRMELIRRLSQIQDEQSNLRSATRRIHEGWRRAVADLEGDPALMDEIARDAARLRKRIDRINDARLGREGRDGLADARESLEAVETIGNRKPAALLEAAEAADRAARGMGRAVAGSRAGEREGRDTRAMRAEVQQLRDRLMRALPAPSSVLPSEEVTRLDGMKQLQSGVRGRAEALMRDDVSSMLPEDGRRAMGRAGRGMRDGAEELGRHRPLDALGGENRAWQGIQDAIDSLRRSSATPRRSVSGEASTEAERDRSLRDELMDAMRERAPEGFDEAVKRYYEELLR